MVLDNLFENGSKKLFFCGIGGSSMLHLAVFMTKLGYAVQGSDSNPHGNTIKVCRENGIPLYFSHSKENISGCNVFIHSAAIKEDNLELALARTLGYEVLSRSMLLGRIEKCYKNSIGVSGTHGKSTTSNMIRSIYLAHGVSATFFAGASSIGCENEPQKVDTDTIIYEACEYNRSFLDMPPKSAVILNIEREHTDTYKTIDDSKNAFFDFAKNSYSSVICLDSPGAESIISPLSKSGVNVHTFSLDLTHSSLFAKNIKCSGGYYSFDAVLNGENYIRDVRLAVPGLHNVSNALASILTASVNGLCDTSAIKKGIESFRGIKRRFEYIGEVNGAHVYDDYAHHPTEIRATLKTARSLGYDKIICAFQPHTYSRTKEFFCDFVTAFDDCDEVVLADVYAAREKNIYNISSEMLANEIKNGKYMKNFSEIKSYLSSCAAPKTLILTMGAGELDQIAKAICQKDVQ